MPNPNIFCSSPWYELHIYWDGSLGICCQESHKLYSGSDYNIATMSIADWFLSEPVRDFRRRMLKDDKLKECSRCYNQEAAGASVRRFNVNQKSVIFNQAFAESFEQSPGKHHFDPSGYTITQPIDLHIDLGNFCNLACKMCHAQASSRIAVQEVKWGIESSRPFVGSNWTKDPVVWHNFKQQLLAMPKLNNIHFMGGETLLTDKFEDLVDTLLSHDRTDVSLSFVTNGTVFNPQLMSKLSRFNRVGIEVSIETVDERNSYVRQGTDTGLVLENIDRYITYCNNTTITTTLRPAISSLTIGSYAGLLQYALEKKLVIKNLIVDRPEFMTVAALPQSIKQQYVSKYTDILNQLAHVDNLLDGNSSDPNNYQQIIKQQVMGCINLLSSPALHNAAEFQQQLVEHCKKWDTVYQQDARVLYPELTEIWDQYGY